MSDTEFADSGLKFEQALVLDTLESAGRFADAELLYRKLLIERPDDPAVLHNLALVLKTLGNLAESETMLRRALAADPSKAAFHNSLGVLLRALNRTDEAEAAYRKSIELWEGYPEAHFNLGVLLEAQNRSDDALACYLEALSWQPGYARALTRVGFILQQRESFDQARQYFETAIAADPQFFDAHYYLSWALSSLKRHDEALAALASATALQPASFEAALATANVLRNAGRFDEALKAYWQALEIQPSRAATHEEINRLAWMAGRKDIYLRSFEYARERQGDTVELLCLEAAFHLRRNDFSAAEQLMLRARELAPGQGQVIGLLARSVAGQDRFAESHALFIAAIEAEPNNLVHRQEFGFALLRGRQPADALTIFEGALSLSPFDQLLLAGITLALREMGDPRYAELVDFAKYVRVYDLGSAGGARDAAAFNEQLAQELDALHLAMAEPIDQTLRGGTQTTGVLFDEKTPAIRQLKLRVEAAIRDYLGQLPDAAWHPMATRKTADFRFAGSWSCRLSPDGYHHNHVHPQGWISSVYYARLPQPASDPADRQGWLKLGESNFALGERDLPNHLVKPMVGRLVLFPSYFWHGTIPFTTAGDRLTISFDVTPQPAQAANLAGAS
jgi:tetratricopeptide (TPR) repeat protein